LQSIILNSRTMHCRSSGLKNLGSGVTSSVETRIFEASHAPTHEAHSFHRRDHVGELFSARRFGIRRRNRDGHRRTAGNGAAD
jgi:hypothetical protein